MTVPNHSDAVRSYGPPTFEVRELEAVGWSMFPALWPGDRVEIGGSEGLSSGEVVAFVGSGGQMVAHRLCGQRGELELLLVRGDANPCPDEPVPRAAVLGRVVRVRRRLAGRWFHVPAASWQRRVVPYAAAWSLRETALLVRRLLRVVTRMSRSKGPGMQGSDDPG